MIITHILLVPLFIVLFACFLGVWPQPLATFRGVTYRRCFEECERSFQCQFIRYRRHASFCALYDDETGTPLQPRKPGLKTKFKNKNSRQNRTQNSTNCQRPPDIPGAVIRGNMVTTGSKIQYKCTGTSLTFPRRCLSNGVWSGTKLLRCNCTVPHGDHHAELGYQQIDERTIEMTLVCDADYELLKRKYAKCVIKTGEWKGTKWAGCYIMSKPPFRKIFSFVDGFVRGNWINANTFVNDLRVYGQYRNSTVFNNWKVYVQKRIRLEIIKAQKVVNFIMFNGTSSDGLSWFSRENILDSSWADLNAESAASMVSIYGIGAPMSNVVVGDTPRAVFVVGKYVQGNNSCEYIGWFMVSLGDYPCDVIIPKGRSSLILYAEGNRTARFRSTKLAVADRLDVWMEE